MRGSHRAHAARWPYQALPVLWVLLVGLSRRTRSQLGQSCWLRAARMSCSAPSSEASSETAPRSSSQPAGAPSSRPAAPAGSGCSQAPPPARGSGAGHGAVWGKIGQIIDRSSRTVAPAFRTSTLAFTSSSMSTCKRVGARTVSNDGGCDPTPTTQVAHLQIINRLLEAPSLV